MKIIAICFLALTTTTLLAQERVKKVEFYGVAKTNIFHQGLNVEDDTTNLSKANYGHSLIDLGILIRPSTNTEVATELRIRNELGGFWGGSVSYGIRKLTLKGVVNDAIRYKIGDLDLEMTPYTLYNNDYQDVVNEATVFQMAREIIDYEYYFSGNSWRQQGLQTDFALEFNSKDIRSLDVHFFSTRNRVANPATASPERLFTGGQLVLNTSYGTINYQTSNLHDLRNTVSDANLYANSVHSMSASIALPKYPKFLMLYEGGISSANYQDLVNQQENCLKDYFWNTGLKYHPNDKLKIQINAINTGPQFWSPSAQNIRLGHSSSSTIFGTIGNDLAVRNMGLIDYLYNDVLYYNTFDSQLDQYNPAFSNALPYGMATPNRKGLSLNIDGLKIIESLMFSSELLMLSEIVGTGTTNLKSYNKATFKAYYNYKKWALKGGIAYETTTRDGASYESVALNSMLIDFGVDYQLLENIFVLWGTKYHAADGNDFTSIYDAYNNPLYFKPSYFNNTRQSLNALGLKIQFSSRSTLTASASSFTQYNNNDYTINQFHLLYRLNF